MSSTVPVISGEAMFWAHDVALGILFIEAARVGAGIPVELRPSCWPELEQDLRTHASVGSGSAVLLDTFTAEQRRILLGCAVEAARRIEARGGVSRDEVSTWPELEESATSFLRGAEHIAAAPLVELAQALVDLAGGTLPPAPAERPWYYGTPEGRITQGGQVGQVGRVGQVGQVGQTIRRWPRSGSSDCRAPHPPADDGPGANPRSGPLG